MQQLIVSRTRYENKGAVISISWGLHITQRARLERSSKVFLIYRNTEQPGNIPRLIPCPQQPLPGFLLLLSHAGIWEQPHQDLVRQHFAYRATPEKLEWEENHSSQGKQTTNTGFFWEPHVCNPQRQDLSGLCRAHRAPALLECYKYSKCLAFPAAALPPPHTI